MSKEFKPNPEPMSYVHALRSLRKIAMESGYALAVHDSCARGLDLIAVRWNNMYLTPDDLVAKLYEEVKNYNFGEDVVPLILKPEHRYANQMHYTIPISGEWYIDLTVIEDRL